MRSQLQAKYPWAVFRAAEKLCHCAWCAEAASHPEGRKLLASIGPRQWHVPPGEELGSTPKTWNISLSNHQRSTLHMKAEDLYKAGEIEPVASPKPSPGGLRKVWCHERLESHLPPHLSLCQPVPSMISPALTVSGFFSYSDMQTPCRPCNVRVRCMSFLAMHDAAVIHDVE